MSEITFNASVKAVVAFEEEHDTSLMKVLQSGKISSIINVVKAVSDATDETIEDFIQKKGFEELQSGLITALVKAGFLPKAAQVAMDKAKADALEALNPTK